MRTTKFLKSDTHEQELSLAASKIYRPDTQVSSVSVFEQPVWHMKEYVELPGQGDRLDTWDHSSTPGFPSGFALAGAELVYAMLTDPVDSHRNSEWLTIRQHLYSLNDFAEFSSSMGCYRFADVDQSLLEDYLNVLMNGDDERESKSPERARTLINFLYRVWEYTPRLSEPLTEIPWGCPKEEILDRLPSREHISGNKTPPIPERIFGPLMNICLDYVLNHSQIIIRAWQDLQNEWELKISKTSLSSSGKEKRLTRAATKILAGYPSPWRKVPWDGRSVLYQELHRLRTACIAVIFAYSGVRCSELFSIEEKCYVYDEIEDGRLICYLNTVLRKHRHKGSKDTWVIVDEVVAAIKVLEQLTQHARTALRTRRLMLCSNYGNNFFNIMTMDNASIFKSYTSNAFKESLQEFQDYIESDLNYDPIPPWTNMHGVDLPWKFNTRQFRRTLARYISRQPFGIIAGMRQYKHVLISVFEGYGSLDAEWIDMVDEEKALAEFDFVDELAIDISTGSIGGAAGKEIKKVFEQEFKGRAEDFPPSTIAKWLSSTYKTLYIGKFNLCFFEPTKARCLRNKEDKEKPILNSCQPDSCKNSCVTKKHLPLWDSQLNQIEDALRFPKISPLASMAMNEEATRIKKIILEVTS